MAKVSIIKCNNYNSDEVYVAIKKSIDLIGGISFVKNKKVLLKPNLLAAVKPEKAITTHPEIVRAVIKLVKENGGTVIVGDSPGIGTQENIYGITGMAKVIEEEGVELANFRDKIEVSDFNGKVNKKFIFAKAVEDADIIFSLAKLKTHGMTYYTGAIKNLFGLVPGLLKPKFHYKFPEKSDFADMLIDLNLAAKPSFAIIDAIIGMEGNGPRNGNSREIGVVMASKDFVAIDSTACRLVSIDPMEIELLKKGYERKYGEIEEKNIEILGDDFESLKIKDFKQIAKELDLGKILPLPKFVNKFIRNLLIPKPYFLHDKCILCNECVKVCPSEPKSLEIKNGKVIINRKSCIRCFCCQEMCPVGAIESKKIILKK